MEQLVARQAHNLEVTCSSRVSATKLKRCKEYFLTPLFLLFVNCGDGVAVYARNWFALPARALAAQRKIKTVHRQLHDS